MEVMNNACNTGSYRVKSNANKNRHSGVLVVGIYFISPMDSILWSVIGASMHHFSG